MYHVPVLLNESIEGLNIDPQGIYVDATLGGGGHASAILERLTSGKLYAFDQDEDSFKKAPGDSRLILVNANFRYIKNFLAYYKAIPVNGILADLGVSSHQLNEASRGFSTRFEGELDLRMNKRKKLDASYIINNYSIDKLRSVFHSYGEIKNASHLAEQIATSRENKPIKTTGQLRGIALALAPSGRENKYLAQVFQALRIEVNDELEALRIFLSKSIEVLASGGRLVVISYHSLEDRIVKNFFRSGNFEGRIIKDFYGNIKVPVRTINKKPITPGEEELNKNPRSRSAKLRIAEKI